MIDAITIDREQMYQGAGRIVVASSLTSFPGRLESVMHPTTYVLASGWFDLGPTDKDGFTLTREASLTDGIEVDQLRTKMNAGEPEDWEMAVECNLLHTTPANIGYVWETTAPITISSTGGVVAQKRLDFDAPASFTERRLAVIQEDPVTGGLRVFAFRKAKPQVEGGELKISSGEVTALPAKFKLSVDSDIDEGYGQFGRLYEETLA